VAVLQRFQQCHILNLGFENTWKHPFTNSYSTYCAINPGMNRTQKDFNILSGIGQSRPFTHPVALV
jgi:hypothetical protein